VSIIIYYCYFIERISGIFRCISKNMFLKNWIIYEKQRYGIVEKIKKTTRSVHHHFCEIFCILSKNMNILARIHIATVYEYTPNP